MRFYVLVSYNSATFKRTLVGLPKDKTQVVINTLGDTQELIHICDYMKVPYVVTESDGTPATGKNSMMEVFLKSDDDYGVFIDSGDILTPTGVEYYQELERKLKPPDLIVLYKQVEVRGEIDVDLLRLNMLVSEFPKEWNAAYPYDKNLHDVYKLSEKQLYDWMCFQQDRVGDDDEIKAQSKERHIFHTFMNEYSEEYEYMTRMVFISRKAAKHINYDNGLLIGEDTVQYLQLKKLALEGHLRVFKKRDGLEESPTYLQVLDGNSITNRRRTTWDWCIPLNRKLEDMQYQGELPTPNVNIPDVKYT